MGQIIDGNLVAKRIRAELAEKVAQLNAQGKSVTLAVILVGQDPASVIYVRNKIKDCEETGIKSRAFYLPEETSEEELLSLIDELNKDASVNGILVQMPLPKQIDESKIIAAIDPNKDVDGFHALNAGRLLVGQKGFVSCTPYGVIKLLESTGENIEGKHAVVIGRSNNVGKPMALLLLNKNATVTICHSKTKNLAEILKTADIIVAAVGRPKMVTADMVKAGAIVIDVGISKVDGKTVGDVDFEAVKEIASYITPMPGGTGPMTRAMLLYNTVEAAGYYG